MDKDGLKALNVEKLEAGLQSRPGSELAGLQGRTDLLIRLAGALADKTDYFGADGRPGNMIGENSVIDMPRLFIQLTQGLRSSSFAPVNPGIFDANCAVASAVECPDERPGAYLAAVAYGLEWCVSWRCMAMPGNAQPWRSVMGIHRAVPQAHAVAHILSYATDAISSQHALCWHRIVDWLARVP